ncbi:MAG: hypothetical protein EOO41_00230, partial [Methanobacteriota archaeon]
MPALNRQANAVLLHDLELQCTPSYHRSTHQAVVSAVHATLHFPHCLACCRSELYSFCSMEVDEPSSAAALAPSTGQQRVLNVPSSASSPVPMRAPILLPISCAPATALVAGRAFAPLSTAHTMPGLSYARDSSAAAVANAASHPMPPSQADPAPRPSMESTALAAPSSGSGLTGTPLVSACSMSGHGVSSALPSERMSAHPQVGGDGVIQANRSLAPLAPVGSMLPGQRLPAPLLSTFVPAAGAAARPTEFVSVTQVQPQAAPTGIPQQSVARTQGTGARVDARRAAGAASASSLRGGSSEVSAGFNTSAPSQQSVLGSMSTPSSAHVHNNGAARTGVTSVTASAAAGKPKVVAMSSTTQGAVVDPRFSHGRLPSRESTFYYELPALPMFAASPYFAVAPE